MKIGNTEVAIKLTIRQAQSLLMFMREVEGLNYQWRGMGELPSGVIGDVKDLKRDFEGLLLMGDQRR
jgi:hypothetical protein